MSDLRIDVDGRALTASWTDENPETREKIAASLPVEGDATRWGEELYFRIPVDVAAENAQTEVPEGAIAYWPQGNALCLFWGPTPASRDGQPRAASPVNVVAQISDVEPLADLSGDASVRIEQV